MTLLLTKVELEYLKNCLTFMVECMTSVADRNVRTQVIILHKSLVNDRPLQLGFTDLQLLSAMLTSIVNSAMVSSKLKLHLKQIREKVTNAMSETTINVEIV